MPGIRLTPGTAQDIRQRLACGVARSGDLGALSGRLVGEGYPWMVLLASRLQNASPSVLLVNCQNSSCVSCSPGGAAAGTTRAVGPGRCRFVGGRLCHCRNRHPRPLGSPRAKARRLTPTAGALRRRTHRANCRLPGGCVAPPPARGHRCAAAPVKLRLFYYQARPHGRYRADADSGCPWPWGVTFGVDRLDPGHNVPVGGADDQSWPLTPWLYRCTEPGYMAREVRRNTAC